jgi:hypothetical protein
MKVSMQACSDRMRIMPTNHSNELFSAQHNPNPSDIIGARDVLLWLRVGFFRFSDVLHFGHPVIECNSMQCSVSHCLPGSRESTQQTLLLLFLLR